MIYCWAQGTQSCLNFPNICESFGLWLMAFKAKNLLESVVRGKGKVSQQDSPLSFRQKPLKLMYCLRVCLKCLSSRWNVERSLSLRYFPQKLITEFLNIPAIQFKKFVFWFRFNSRLWTANTLESTLMSKFKQRSFDKFNKFHLYHAHVFNLNLMHCAHFVSLNIYESISLIQYWLFKIPSCSIPLQTHIWSIKLHGSCMIKSSIKTFSSFQTINPFATAENVNK